MLSRLLARSTNLRYLTLIPPHCLSLSSPSPNFTPVIHTFRGFSSNRNNNNNGDKFNKDPPSSNTWKITPDDDEEEAGSVFGDLTGDIPGADDELGKGGRVSRPNVPVDDSWGNDDEPASSDIFGGIDKELEAKKSDGSGGLSWGDESLEPSDVFGDIDASKRGVGEGGGDDWETAEGYKAWSIEEEEKKEVFDLSRVSGDVEDTEEELPEEEVPEKGKGEPAPELEKEKIELSVTLKGPNRAFGDLIAASGITDAMLDSLIVLKDLEGVEGLPPLSVIEDLRLEKNMAKNTRADIERQKQEEIAKSRVRRVDDKGRAYGTGRRKCSVARVFIEPGEGQFLVNDKQFDVYFPILDHRATLLSPFSETKTLGLWDVKCTVKGGGVSGQVGAIRLGISRALQNWEPGLRPNLRAAGFLTRDPRAVERKKPGKAKARKSFQWVKR